MTSDADSRENLYHRPRLGYDICDGPCYCGFRERCESVVGSTDPHNLSLINCETVCADVTDKFADSLNDGSRLHRDQLVANGIISLEDVRRAWYRAVISFQQYKTYNQWVYAAKSHREWHRALRPPWEEVHWPVNIAEELESLKKLETLFSSKQNLCLTSAGLAKAKDCLLQAYYMPKMNSQWDIVRAYVYTYFERNQEKIDSIHKSLHEMFEETHDPVYWAVSHLLQDFTNFFFVECDIARRLVDCPRSTGERSFDPWKYGVDCAAQDLVLEEVMDVDQLLAGYNDPANFSTFTIQTAPPASSDSESSEEASVEETESDNRTSQEPCSNVSRSAAPSPESSAPGQQAHDLYDYDPASPPIAGQPRSEYHRDNEMSESNSSESEDESRGFGDGIMRYTRASR